MTRIGFIRHGTTAWNTAKRAQGHSNIPLDKSGLFEAEKLAVRMQRENWDVLYSSDLARAKQTAETIGNICKMQVHLDKRLRERNGGKIEGTTEAERLSIWGVGWRKLDLGMENESNIVERGFAFLEEVTNKHPDKNILIVTHGAFIKYLLRALIPHSDEPIEGIQNTSVSCLDQTIDGWDLNLLNCINHLVEE